MIGIFLYLLSILFGFILLPAGLLFGLFSMWYKKKFWSSWRNIGRKFLKMAEGIDRYGNIACAELLTATLITKESKFPFGNGRETISSCLGRNLQAGTLSGTGKAVNTVLDFFDPGHSIKSIGY